jgi:prepilin-type N-terminal cleavage/methylation domain-containing protein
VSVPSKRNVVVNSQRGVSLIEVVIAIGLMGIIAVAFFRGLGGSSKALVTADERTTAESLARTQMEAIKRLTYSSGNYTAAPIPPGYTGYTVSDPIVPIAVTDNVTGYRLGLQKIAITVYHQGEPVLTLEDYKAR